VNGNTPTRTHGGHPFTQRRDGDFAADDHECDQAINPTQLEKYEKCSANNELVCNGVQERPECRGLTPAPGKPPIKPVGNGCNRKEQGRRQISIARGNHQRRQQVQKDQERNREDAQ